MSLESPPLSLYIHLPWCVRKCPYCDFNSHALREDLPEQRYVDALIADLEHDLPMIWGRPVISVFLGGGTPSLFSAESIGRLLDGVRSRVMLHPGAEITMETNPGTVEHAPLEGYRDAGVNRLSLGVQSFDDGLLRRIGRIHGSAEARSAAERAHEAGFEHLNIDLMYALPGQSLAQAMKDLEVAIALDPDHLSHYQLTIEPNTLFHNQPPRLPDDELAWSMQDGAVDRLTDAGYQHYEISAWARPGGECRHNLNYWQFGDYLGIGAGAHGKVTHAAENRVWRYWKQRHPSRYLATAGTAECVGERHPLDAADLRFEFALNAFRLSDGVPETWYAARTGQALDVDDGAWHQALERGWLERQDGRIRPTEVGQRFLNDLQMLFLTDAA
jgi:oxygen-independent coproporphyrinogen-3 oxidase